MLTRVVPMETLDANKPQPRIVPVLFKGEWNSQSRTLTCTEGGAPGGLPVEAVENDSARPKQSFELVIATDGKVTVQNSKHLSEGQIVAAKVTDRTGEAPENGGLLVGKRSFQSVDEKRILGSSLGCHRKRPTSRYLAKLLVTLPVIRFQRKALGNSWTSFGRNRETARPIIATRCQVKGCPPIEKKWFDASSHSDGNRSKTPSSSIVPQNAMVP